MLISYLTSTMFLCARHLKVLKAVLKALKVQIMLSVSKLESPFSPISAQIVLKFTIQVLFGLSLNAYTMSKLQIHPNK